MVVKALVSVVRVQMREGHCGGTDGDGLGNGAGGSCKSRQCEGTGVSLLRKMQEREKLGAILDYT
jgi:hypothetical protein